MNMHISNVNNQVHELALPTCVLLLSKNFLSFSILQCCSLFVHINVQIQLLPNASCIFHVFVPISPPLSPIFIKDVLLIDAKAYIGVDGWGLKLAFLWTLPHILEWHHLCSFWDTTYRIFDLDTNWWGTSPYVIAWVIHLIILSSCMWGNLHHLWNHRLAWLIPHVGMWYHLEEFTSMAPLVGFVNFDHFLNICYFHEYHL
jgi:hypothetical protein